MNIDIYTLIFFINDLFKKMIQNFIINITYDLYNLFQIIL